NTRINAHIEPKILEFCPEARKPLRLLGLGAKFSEIEKFPERLVAAEPSLLIEDVGLDRRHGELQIDARILTQRGIVNQLTERMHVIGGLRRNDDAEAFRPLAHGRSKRVEQVGIRRLRVLVERPE